MNSIAEADIQSMLESDAVMMTANTSTQEKIELIALQKWVHFNIVQPYQNWAEVRRLDYPTLEFWNDNSSVQPLPPIRWGIAGREISFNPNYADVSGMDDLEMKLFWNVD